MSAGGARIAYRASNQIFGLFDVLPGSGADLLLAGRGVRCDVELAALVPARETAELGGGADVGAAGEQGIERNVSVIERLEASFQIVFLEHLPLGCDNERRVKRINSGRGRNLFERGVGCARERQCPKACSKRYAEYAAGHAW